MQSDGAQTMASFTGTLLRREHTLGQKFVQLVFREGDHDVLCVSTNPQTAALPIGQAYKVEGSFRQRGEQSFLLEPKIATLKKHWRPIRRVLFVCIVLACVAGIGGVAYMQQHGAAVPPAPASGYSSKPTVTGTTQPSTPVSAPAAPAATPAPAPTTTTSKPKTATKTVATVAATAPVVAAPTNACTTQAISFGTQYQEDDSLVPGATGPVIQQGVNGSEQVCTLSGITVTLQPVPEIVSVGPSTAQ